MNRFWRWAVVIYFFLLKSELTLYSKGLCIFENKSVFVIFNPKFIFGRWTVSIYSTLSLKLIIIIQDWTEVWKPRKYLFNENIHEISQVSAMIYYQDSIWNINLINIQHLDNLTAIGVIIFLDFSDYWH